MKSSLVAFFSLLFSPLDMFNCHRNLHQHPKGGRKGIIKWWQWETQTPPLHFWNSSYFLGCKIILVLMMKRKMLELKVLPIIIRWHQMRSDANEEETFNEREFSSQSHQIFLFQSKDFSKAKRWQKTTAAMMVWENHKIINSLLCWSTPWEQEVR